MAVGLVRCMVGVTLLLVGEASAQTAPAAAPPVSSDPQSTTATFGDWTVRCQRSNEPAGQRLCEAAQVIQIQGQGPIAQIAIGRLSPRDPIKLTVVLPSNITLPSVPRLRIDEKDAQAADLTWRRCMNIGCVADLDMRDDMLRRWRTQNERGRLEFKDAGGRDVVLPFSFRGLSQGLDALAKM